ncbi:hypothetical protein Patl1_08685 [Pistacia atlantica]|uniref:Uncharacterized protein n=1 Tax=Pistacia atlantica TaxID=434234 RepID=A0ACC1AKY5_9ROSI|nr:hypothetical protein Patl1_08685 [Pistacia atlantica]
MAASPVKFLFGFLVVSITLWMVFMFASRLVAWILSRILGASVGFRVGGWKCVRDVVVKFKKGAIESVSVGEIKVSLRQSLVKLGVGFISKDPKLQVLICDLEVVMRPSSKSSKKTKTRKPRSSGRGKWMVVANTARFLSVSVTDMVVKMPKSTIEVKELTVDISKDGGSKPGLLVTLHILPIFVYIGEPRISYDQSSNSNTGGCISSSQASFSMMEKSSAPFSCEELSLSCEFGHDREAGVVIQNVDITCGDVTVGLNEELLSKKKKSPDAFVHTEKVTELTSDSVASVKADKKQASLATLTKYASIFPEKDTSFPLFSEIGMLFLFKFMQCLYVVYNLSRFASFYQNWKVRFLHQEHGLVVENNIMGIQLKSTKSRSTEDVGESTRLDFLLDFSEIHLIREAGTSVLEIMKVDVISSVYIPVQVSPGQLSH